MASNFPANNVSITAEAVKLPSISHCFQVLFQSVPQPTVLLDGVNTILSANQAFFDTFRLTAVEVISQKISNLEQGAWDFPRLRELLDDATSIEKVDSVCQIEHDFPAAGRKIFKCNAAAVHDEENEELVILLTLEDVTKQRGIEETLRNNEQRTQSILNTAVDAIVMIDQRGIVKSFNPAAELLFGYTADELLGENVSLLMPNPYCEEHDHYLANYLETGNRKVIGIGREVIGKRHDGTVFPMNLSVSEIYWGGRRQFIGTVRDITQNKRAKTALGNSEARVRAILNTAVDSIVTIDIKGKIKSINPAAQRMFGYSIEEVIGENVSMLMPAPYCDEHDQYLQNYLETGKRKVIGIGREVVGKCKDGTTFPMELSVSEVLQGNYRIFTGIVRDMSQRKRTEQRLREYTKDVEESRAQLEEQALQLELQAQNLREAQNRAESANDAKSEFLANMSHEIRTPMTAILGYADLMLQMADDHRMVDAAETIKRNGQHLLEILNDILDISKIEAGKLLIESISCSPLEVIAETVSLMNTRAEDKKLTLKVDLLGPIPEKIQTDPTRLRQILLNLLGNAIKFTQQGEVRLAVKLEQSTEKTELLRFEVIDSGIGISQQALGILFAPFTQADASTTRRFGGSGMGLTICKRLTQILGGQISVESKLDVGSTFRVTIATGSLQNVKMLNNLTWEDYLAKRKRPQGKQQNREGLLRESRILLVEDGVDNQRLITMVLKKAGAEVVLAENGKIACDIMEESRLQNEAFDLIMMDMQMPVLDGYIATRQLREAGFELPIVALTAHAMTGDREKCLTAGCDDYMTKPIDARHLVELVAEIIASADIAKRDLSEIGT